MNNDKIEEHMKMHLQNIARKLKGEIPEGWGFIFLTYPHGEENNSLLYVSNSQREDVVKCMEEFIEKTKSTYGNDTGKY